MKGHLIPDIMEVKQRGNYQKSSRIKKLKIHTTVIKIQRTSPSLQNYENAPILIGRMY